MLFDGEVACVKVGGQAFQGFRFFADFREGEGGRLGVAGDGQPDLVVFVGVHRAGAGAANVRYARKRGFRPVFRRVVNGEAGFDVFEGFQDEVVFGPGATGERGVFVRGEKRGEFAFARHPVVVVGDEVAAGGVGFVAERPVFTRGDDQPVAHHAFFGGIGHVDFLQFAVFQALVEFVGVDVDGAADEVAFVAGGVVVYGADDYVVRLALIDDFGLVERGTARPQAGFARVAGVGQAACAEVGLDIDVVFVYPTHGAFGGGAVVAVFDECAFFQVVFAGFVGIRAAGGEADEAMAVVGAQAVGAVPDPGGVFGLVERVEVEDVVPLRVGFLVFVQRGAAPDAARVFVVLPVVVVVVAALADVGDFFLGVEDGEDVGFGLFEVGAGGQRFFGNGVLGAYPLQGAFAFDVFQPEVRVLGVCHGSARLDKEEGEGQFFHVF